MAHSEDASVQSSRTASLGVEPAAHDAPNGLLPFPREMSSHFGDGTIPPERWSLAGVLALLRSIVTCCWTVHLSTCFPAADSK